MMTNQTRWHCKTCNWQYGDLNNTLYSEKDSTCIICVREDTKYVGTREDFEYTQSLNKGLVVANKKSWIKI